MIRPGEVDFVFCKIKLLSDDIGSSPTPDIHQTSHHTVRILFIFHIAHESQSAFRSLHIAVESFQTVDEIKKKVTRQLMAIPKADFEKW